MIDKSITTAHGLLYRNGEMIPLPAADRVAEENGFVYAEHFVKYLEEKNKE